MKAKDIKEFELGSHCFGEILNANGVAYEDIGNEEIMELIVDMFENDVNASHLIREAFKNSLEHLQYECKESDSDSCGQCGDYNHYNKYVAKD